MPNLRNREEFLKNEFASEFKYDYKNIKIEPLGNENDIKEHIGKTIHRSRDKCVNQFDEIV